MADVLRRQYLGMGDDVRRFEQRLAEMFGRPTVCVVNGTAALHLAVQGCGIGPGDEVLLPSLTYVASFQAISATGARPVACDIDPATLFLDCEDAARRISLRTKAVMPVFYSGDPGPVEKIYALARTHGLRVIEDAAHAFGTRVLGRPVGAAGDVTCFSFDGIKNITSGEGGCIVTADESLLAAVRDSRLLGVGNDTAKRFSGERSWLFDVQAQGWRYHMSNIMAAIGLTQLDRFPAMAATRQRLAMQYDRLLQGHPLLQVFQRDYSAIVPHIYVIRLNEGCSRDRLRSRLAERGIQTGLHYQPNHWLSFYRDPSAAPLPATDRVFPTLLTLPLHAALTEEEVSVVCESIFECLNDPR